jgi:very-short-patch-repair endonuclease
VEYINNHTKVKIICPIHGIFEQRPCKHLNAGQKCPKCSIIKVSDSHKYDTKKFIELSINKHGDKYDYSLTEYKKAHEKLLIKCPKHGIFKQMAYSHLNGIGCPNCSTSKGEIIVENYLRQNFFNYEKQKTFDGCVYKKLLRFDFYLPEFNICIEYDGNSHFKPWHNDNDGIIFSETKLKDSIKNDFCHKMGIKLIRVNMSNINELNFLIKD